MNTQPVKDFKILRLLRDRGGNFGIITALLLPVALGAGGVAIDLSNIAMSQRQLQEASDSAALAAASALASGKVNTIAEAQALAKDFVAGQMANYLSGNTPAIESIKDTTNVAITEIPNGTGKTFDVTVRTSYSMSLTPFMRVFGRQTAEIAAASGTTSSTSTTETKSALSMALVLDKSGSMLLNTDEIDPSQYSCTQYYTVRNNLYQYEDKIHPCYIKKIAALKTAANMLLTQLDAADPESKYIRTEAIAWSSQIDSSNSFGWGTSNTRTRVINRLEASGGTESAAPMAEAYKDLRSQDESNAQTKGGNSVFTKYIVLMTDGENNNSSSDGKTLTTCTNAKAAGMEIYAVAFMAPAAGQKLLAECATDASHYFNAENMQDLVSAFKSIGQKASSQTIRLTQ